MRYITVTNEDGQTEEAKVVNLTEAARIVGVSYSTMYKYVVREKRIKAVQYGGRKSQYNLREADVIRFRDEGAVNQKGSSEGDGRQQS